MLMQNQIKSGLQGEWNFGPDFNCSFTVNDLIENFCQSWGQRVKIRLQSNNLKESEYLSINSSHSSLNLGWKQKLDFKQSVDWTSKWYKSSDPEAMTKNQIHHFIAL